MLLIALGVVGVVAYGLSVQRSSMPSDDPSTGDDFEITWLRGDEAMAQTSMEIASSRLAVDFASHPQRFYIKPNAVTSYEVVGKRTGFRNSGATYPAARRHPYR